VIMNVFSNVSKREENDLLGQTSACIFIRSVVYRNKTVDMAEHRRPIIGRKYGWNLKMACISYTNSDRK
jgi:hypothetical protein